MRRIIRILAGALATLAILGVILLVYLSVADLSRYKEQVESFVSGRSGLELRIDGQFELDFGSLTTLVADDVTLSNPAWPEQPELIHVGHLGISVRTWSLFFRPVSIESLDVDNVRAAIIRDDEGRVNWAPQQPVSREPASSSFDLNQIAFREVRVESVNVTYDSPARRQPLRLGIAQLSVLPDDEGILDLDIDGNINELPLLAKGKLGPWRNFVAGRNILTDLDVTLGPIAASVDGTLENLPQMEGVDLDGDLSGSNLGEVLETLELPPFANGELQLRASVHRAAEGHAVQLSGTFGEVSLSANGTIDSLVVPRHSAYEFEATGPNARHVAELFGIERLPTRPFRLAGKYTRDGPQLGFEDVLLEIDANSLRFDGAIDTSDMDLTIDLTANGPDFSVFAPILGVESLPQERFELSGRMARDGAVWEADGVEMTIGGHLLFANGRVRAGSSDTTEIGFTLDGPDLSIVRGFTRFEGIPSHPYDLDFVLRSHPDGIEIVEGTGIFGEYRVNANGVLRVAEGLSGTEGRVRISGPDLGGLYLHSSMQHLPRGPFDITGDVRLEGDALLISNARGTVGSIDATANGQLLLRGNPGNFALDISLEGPDVTAMTEKGRLDRLSGEPFRISGKVLRDKNMLSAQNLDVSVANLHARVNGRMVGLADSFDIDVAAQAVDTSVVRKWSSFDELPDTEVAVDGRVSKTGDQLKFSDASLNIGAYRAFANGTLDLEPLQNDSELDFSVSGPSLYEVGSMFSFDRLPDKPFEFKGQFDGTATGFQIDNLAARLGKADLSGKLRANLEGKPRYEASFSSSYIDISDAINRRKAAAEAALDQEQVEKDRIFSSDPLSESWLREFDLDLKVKIGQLIANTIRVTDVNVGMMVENGGLRVDPFYFRDGTGSVDAYLGLVPTGSSYAMESRLEVEDIHVGLLAEKDQDRTTLPSFRGSAQIAGRGESIRAIMGSANGDISLQQGPGRVREVVGVGIFQDVVVQSLRSIIPSREEGKQNLDCAFYDATIEDGVLTFDRIALQTKAIQLVASGRIRLQSERIDMTFRAKPRQGLGVSLGTVANSFLAIGGTLSHPTVSFDPARSAATTGAAVATSGLSLVARGLWDRLTAQANICKELGR